MKSRILHVLAHVITPTIVSLHVSHYDRRVRKVARYVSEKIMFSCLLPCLFTLYISCLFLIFLFSYFLTV